MPLLTPQKTEKNTLESIDFHIPTSKKALIIFARNPELGKCKTRLAKTLGEEAALEIYKHLLRHTASVAKEVHADRYVFYSECITEDLIWSSEYFRKKRQQGDDLGQRMQQAFVELLALGYQKVCIIGSDLMDLTTAVIEKAFQELDRNDAVIGPSEDGGYYLLGMKKEIPEVFNIEGWSSKTVYAQTLSKLKKYQVTILETLNDIDYAEDLKPYPIFEKYHPKGS